MGSSAGKGESKAAVYRDHLDSFLDGLVEGAVVQRKTLETLAGRLGFCTQLSRWCCVFMTSIWRALWPPGTTGEPPSRVTVTRELLDDLRGFWQVVLRNPEAAWLRRSQWSCLAIGEARAHEHFISSSDASGRWGTAGISEWGSFQRRWRDAEEGLHITFKELIGAVETVIAVAGRYRGSRVVVLCDNEAAVSYICRAST